MRIIGIRDFRMNMADELGRLPFEITKDGVIIARVDHPVKIVSQSVLVESVTLPEDSESESSVILENTEKPAIRSTKPEMKKSLPKNPGKRAIIAKIKETGHFNPQPKNKDKK